MKHRGRQKKMTKSKARDREHDFALVLTGIAKLTARVENALFNAGCDDGTLSMRLGVPYLTFSRRAPTIKDAIISAIHQVRHAGIGADVARVDLCDMVTQSDIARRIGRSRQLVNQYIAGERGPGKFPPPACHIAEGTPLWLWCEVAVWLSQNDILKGEDARDAEHVAFINNVLERMRYRQRSPKLLKEILDAVEC